MTSLAASTSSLPRPAPRAIAWGSPLPPNDARLQWRHPLRPGEVLLFDNWRVLHGRAAYQGARRLCGAYLNREDFESRLRLLRHGPT
jgi:Taurine catabolism dioxygenase TauD, TfdA family